MNEFTLRKAVATAGLLAGAVAGLVAGAAASNAAPAPITESFVQSAQPAAAATPADEKWPAPPTAPGPHALTDTQFPAVIPADEKWPKMVPADDKWPTPPKLPPTVLHA